MTRARSVLLAALIVCSTVVGAVGPALAQSTETATDSGPVTKTFETGPHKIKVDLFDVSSETTITVITDESPAGNNTAILKKTVSGSHNSAHFRNAGAYESFTVKVEGADGPVSFSKGGPTAAWTPGDNGKFLGDTGGDPGFTYDMSEQIGEAVMPSIVQLDRTGLPDTGTVDTTETDAEQLQIDIYGSAQNDLSATENQLTTIDNNLADAKTVARVKGKNAYIRALNNGSSQTAATTSAKEAVAEYYATYERALLNDWSRSVYNQQRLSEIAANESVGSSVATVYYVNDNGQDRYYRMFGSTTTVTLQNGDSITVAQRGISDGSDTYYNPTTGVQGEAGSGDVKGVIVPAPNSNYDQLLTPTADDYNTRWQQIQSESSTVKSDMETLASNTYTEYQNGEINSSDLVDPYVLANQQSAGDDFQGWTAAQLTLLGTNSPENFDQIGSFNVTTESGTQYEGVLFSQENPASGQFENGTTYNTSKIGGTQYVVTSDRVVELDGTFTIDRITTTNGENVQNVTIQKTTYETSNVTELKQQYEDLAYRRAQIEAREKAMKQSAGGGLLGGGSVSPVVALAVIGTLLGIVVLQD
ncbi:hypothetical protein [Haloarcula argentinensis]|uniref:Envelope protein N-terminal domain-containing protein n=1 Tax=Haloarcula argentinensis TaxID=43776 RepID=A0ABU2F2E7_HALAR|nr:hypothetical protein [Haloarcula argentinensis]EMA20009.1 hypothetical protein C443_14272 [Haloarcula argentinensis DSM 12282]MDS0254713.1 hypothetical protein [Haloarcula argentinensis]